MEEIDSGPRHFPPMSDREGKDHHQKWLVKRLRPLSAQEVEDVAAAIAMGVEYG